MRVRRDRAQEELQAQLTAEGAAAIRCRRAGRVWVALRRKPTLATGDERRDPEGPLRLSREPSRAGRGGGVEPPCDEPYAPVDTEPGRIDAELGAPIQRLFSPAIGGAPPS